MTCKASPRSRAVTAAGPRWHGVLRACLDQLEPMPAGANLGIAYLGERLAPVADDIVRALQQRTGVRQWLGASGSAVLGSHGGPDENGLAVLVTSVADAGFRILSSPAAPLRDCGLLLAHAEIEDADPGAGAAAFAGAASVQVVGGLTAAGRSPVQIASDSMGSALAGIAFRRGLPVLSGIARAGSPLGPLHRVTSALGSTILALDGRPALEVMGEEMGDLFRHVGPRHAGSLWLAEPDPTAGEDLRMRRITGLDRDRGALTVSGGRLAPRIRLMRPDPAGSLARVGDLARGLLKGLDGRPPVAGLYLASRHRGGRLFGPGVDELALLRQELGALPLIGLVTDAEIFGGVIHEGAGILVLLG
jgi:small ligand-binding sensory domain FIST